MSRRKIQPLALSESTISEYGKFENDGCANGLTGRREKTMKKLSEIINLEKQSEVEICYCDIIADSVNDAENIRTRILHDDDDRYYYHQMQNGKVTECFEIALSWKPWDDHFIFCFTPDDLHICEIDSRHPDKVENLKLEWDSVKRGMSCEYAGMTVEYESENSIKFNGKSIPVTRASGYTYKLMKRKILANGGAKELYRFLENIAAKGNAGEYDEVVKIGNFALADDNLVHWARFKKMYV